MYTCDICGTEYKTDAAMRGCMKKDKEVLAEINKKAADKRKARKQFGSPNFRLEAEGRLGMERRWVNDTRDRIQKMMARGYEKVQSEGESVRKVLAGTKEDGSAMYAYLMEIEKVLYDEDQKAKQDEIDDKESAIYRGENDKLGGNGYVPKEGIKVHNAFRR